MWLFQKRMNATFWENQTTNECFLYQCDEDATCHEGLFKALKELERMQALHIVQNNPLWQQATWG